MRRKFTIQEEQEGDYFRQEQRIQAIPAATHLEHLSLLKIDDPPHVVRKTGIICTLGK